MTITPFSTITLKATPDGVTESFIDMGSIQAASVRAYNSDTVEAFLSVGSIVDFPLPAKDGVILCKGEGVSQIMARTESGSATIRCTAIQETNGSDVMGTLSMVSILKDAMGSQDLIDKAVDKLTNANKISEANKQETADALKSIADANYALKQVADAKAAYDKQVADYNVSVAKKSADLEKQQTDIANQKLSLEALHQEHLTIVADLQKQAEDRHKSADIREADLDERLKNIIAQENQNLTDKMANETEGKRLESENNKLIQAQAKFEARKKKIAEATKED